MTMLTGWGRSTGTVGTVDTAADVEAVRRAVLGATDRRGVLARGMGRSYGDAASNGGGHVLDCTPLTEIGEVDGTGGVTVGAGVSMGALIDAMLPLGWFVPVVPGTRHVTLGGAVAADVHGKNHHRDGSIGAHILGIQLVDGKGEVRDIGPRDAAFGAVLGGLGLSGVVTAVRLRMHRVESAGILVRTRRTKDLDDTMAALVEADARHRYTVAWLDTISRGRAAGRGVITSGDHAPGPLVGGIPLDRHRVGATVTAPPWAPSGLLQPATVRTFNALWYRSAPRTARERIQDVTGFFHPLDRVEGWNRLYGRRGFVQHQFAVADTDTEVVRRILGILRGAGAPGFLAVLKRFGPSDGAPLSFPSPGWTLAVDLPAHPILAPVLDEADEIIAAAGGRVYLVKDSRMRPDLVPVMYPQLDRWRELRARLDPERVFISDLARRLSLC